MIQNKRLFEATNHYLLQVITGVVAAFYGVRKWLAGKGRKQNGAAPDDPAGAETKPEEFVATKE